MSDVKTTFQKVDMHVQDLPTLELDPEEAAQMGLVEGAEESSGRGGLDSLSHSVDSPSVVDGVDGSIESVHVDPEALRNVLELGFRGGYLIFRHEHWVEEDIQEELDLMVPRGVKWLEARPKLARAVEKADTESFPALVAYSFGKRTVASLRMKKAEREAAQDAWITGQGTV